MGCWRKKIECKILSERDFITIFRNKNCKKNEISLGKSYNSETPPHYVFLRNHLHIDLIFRYHQSFMVFKTSLPQRRIFCTFRTCFDIFYNKKLWILRMKMVKIFSPPRAFEKTPWVPDPKITRGTFLNGGLLKWNSSDHCLGITRPVNGVLVCLLGALQTGSARGYFESYYSNMS